MASGTDATAAAAHRFMQDRIIAERETVEVDPPEDAMIFRRELENRLLRKVRGDLDTHGRWFYCTWDNRHPGKPGIYPETATVRTYGSLYELGYKLADMPGYSAENHGRAVAFWQSWQNRQSGYFYNPEFTDPQNPGEYADHERNGKVTNGKYLTSIYRLLGVEPLYPSPFSGTAEVDLEHTWDLLEQGHGNGIGMQSWQMLQAIDHGRHDYIPYLELAGSALLKRIDPVEARIGKQLDKPWSEYGGMANTFKFYRRYIEYFGCENMPHLTTITNQILAHAGQIAEAGYIGHQRNAVEVCVICIQHSDYRKAELLQAMALLALSIARDPLAKVKDDGATPYATYGLSMAASYLNWRGWPVKNGAFLETMNFTQGAIHDSRLTTGPYQRWINVVPRSEKEKLLHPDYAYADSGLKPANRRHSLKSIYELTPTIHRDEWEYCVGSGACCGSWQEGNPGVDPVGKRIVMRAAVDIGDPDTIGEAYLRARWNGGFSVSINGVEAKTVPYAAAAGSFDDSCGLRLSPDAARTLKKGANTIEVVWDSWLADGYLEAAIIDWR
jgi:hypothetical protein